MITFYTYWDFRGLIKFLYGNNETIPKTEYNRLLPDACLHTVNINVNETDFMSHKNQQELRQHTVYSTCRKTATCYEC